MPRGGFRVNSGRNPDNPKQVKKAAGIAKEPKPFTFTDANVPVEVVEEVITSEPKITYSNKFLSPLVYALRVMNDEQVDEARRDRMAIAAMQFCHLKKGEGGKKDKLMENAEKAGAGKFSQSSAPKLIVNNK